MLCLHRRHCAAIVVLLCFANFSRSSLAQNCHVSSDGTQVQLYGDVVDPSNAFVANAFIELHCGAERLTTATDKAGHYSVRALPGKWMIEIRVPGFNDVEQLYSVAEEDGQRLDFHLQLSSISARVEVNTGAVGYVSSDSDLGTHTNTSILEIPQSVYVVPQAVLRDQQAVRLTDATRNVSGISFGNDAGGRYESLVIRGFTSGALFKDRFRNDSASNLTFTEMSNIDRIEVLKGPSSTIFGRLDPSGVVNLVTRQPLPFRQMSVQMQGGSFQFLHPSIDVTGSLAKSGRVLGRFIASGQDSKSFRNFNVQHRLFLSPTLTWTPTSQTSVRFYSEFLGGSGMTDRGLIALGTRPANLPISRYLADPSLQYPYRQGKAGVTVDQSLGKRWAFHSAERSSTGYGMYNARIANSLLTGNTTVRLNDIISDQYFQTHYWINEATGKVNTGWLEQTLLAGFELNYETFDTKTLRATTASAALENLNIYNPNYAALPVRSMALSRLDQTRNGYGGGYLQDQLHLGSKLLLTAGIRYDQAKLKTVGYFTTVSSSYRQNAWSPRLGLTYLPVHSIALYATWSRSFQPESGLDANGNSFTPERGKLLETGMKYDALHGHAGGTVSIYQVDRQNVLTTDPNNTAYQIQVGGQRSRGMEWNQTVRVAGGWNLINGYAFNQATVTRDNVYLVGTGLVAAPRHTGNLWLQYQPHKKYLQGVSLGAGVFGASKSEGQLRTQAAPGTYFLLPGYARFDMGASYELTRPSSWHYRFAVNTNNVLDRRYFSGSGGRFAVYPGSPRSLIFSLQILRSGESR